MRWVSHQERTPGEEHWRSMVRQGSSLPSWVWTDLVVEVSTTSRPRRRPLRGWLPGRSGCASGSRSPVRSLPYLHTLPGPCDCAIRRPGGRLSLPRSRRGVPGSSRRCHLPRVRLGGTLSLVSRTRSSVAEPGVHRPLRPRKCPGGTSLKCRGFRTLNKNAKSADCVDAF